MLLSGRPCFCESSLSWSVTERLIQNSCSPVSSKACLPEFQRGNSLAYLNSAPPLEPEAPSLYAISPPAADWDARRTKTLLEEYNSHMLQILTIHEAYPGHYVQLEYSNRAGSLLRRVLQSGVYIEGWAVYTEQTLLDQGYGEGDPRLRLMQLKFYLRAVGNAILDHLMHAQDMSDEEAFAFLTKEAFQSDEEARQKIVRAKQTSVQLSTYFVGRMAMQRLRDEVQAKMGEKFNLGRYHVARSVDRKLLACAPSNDSLPLSASKSNLFYLEIRSQGGISTRYPNPEKRNPQ